jgi:monoamine oxidase
MILFDAERVAEAVATSRVSGGALAMTKLKRRQEMKTRRGVFRAWAGAAVGLSAPAVVGGPVGAASGKVVVVGAGIAGIAAARALEDAGLDAVVLEARTRIGGRIWTDDSLDVPLDLGASWIHGAAAANPIWALRNQYGLRTVPTNYDDIAIYDADGQRVSTSEAEADSNRYFQLYRTARRWGRRRQRDVSLQAGMNYAIRQEGLTPVQRRAVAFHLNYNVEQDYGGAASELSILNYDQDLWLGGRQDAIVRDGYEGLTTVLADGLDVRRGQRAEAIEYGSSGVTVRTERSAFDAAFAVVTVPLGVLKAGDIRFDPALPRRKQAAIDRLGVGSLNKLYLKFSEQFWDEREQIGYMAATKGAWSLWFDYSRIVNEPILLGLNAAAYGAAIERKSDEQTVDEAMDVLRTMYGDALPEPREWLITRWNEDKFARGAYSHIPPGARGLDYRTLAEPTANSVFWAGEATSRKYPQTVAGAYLSGRRAANQIIAL